MCWFVVGLVFWLVVLNDFMVLLKVVIWFMLRNVLMLMVGWYYICWCGCFGLLDNGEWYGWC